jgi:hypothetical protein
MDRRFQLLVAGLLLAAPLVACDREEGPFEEAGEELDEAGEELEDTFER